MYFLSVCFCFSISLVNSAPSGCIGVCPIPGPCSACLLSLALTFGMLYLFSVDGCSCLLQCLGPPGVSGLTFLRLGTVESCPFVCGLISLLLYCWLLEFPDLVSWVPLGSLLSPNLEFNVFLAFP